jgi:hypothetical protein
LKPDVCRRVVGRLPSPHIQISSQKPFWFQQRGMAPPFSLRISPPNLIRKRNEKFTVVYLVRSFRTYARIRSLTTGTFNLVVKDRIAFRQSGAPSVQANPLLERIRLSSKPFNHIVRAKPCQRTHPTAFPRVFHMRKLCKMGGRGAKTSA